MSDRTNADMIEGRWEDIVSDVHRFDGKTVRISVIENSSLSADEWKQRFATWLEHVRTNPLGDALPIPDKVARREMLGDILEEKDRKSRVVS